MSSSAMRSFRTAATASADQIVDATCEEGETAFWLIGVVKPDVWREWSLRPSIQRRGRYRVLPPRASMSSAIVATRSWLLAGLKWAGSQR